MKKREKKQLRKILIAIIFSIIIAILGYYGYDISAITGMENNNVSNNIANVPTSDSNKTFKISEIPKFDGNTPYVTINNNIPNFEEKYFTTKSFEEYAPLDSLGRCGVAFANVSVDTMPTGERGAISKIKPTGWQNTKYDFIDGKYLYNRCHLIGFQLTAENANERNLITGTRFMNVQGMLPFENKVAEYIKKNKKHVLYRVTPIFEGDNLVVSGVEMEAESVEDKGSSIMFNVYVYNNQPKVTINYATGASSIK